MEYHHTMITINAKKLWVVTFLFSLTNLVLLCLPTQSRAEADPHAHHKAMLKKLDSIKRSIHKYTIPEISLLSKSGAQKTTSEIFNTNKPILLNFIFTSCNTICPVLSGTFSQIDKKMTKLKKDVELISITIDPEYDTPRVLNGYAKKFNSSDNWKFYTGSREDIITLQTAFNAYRGSKMNHAPITLLRTANNKEWIRIDGFASAKQLLTEIGE